MKKFLAILLCLLLALPATGAWAENNMMADGTYTASAQGMDGPVDIELTVKDNEITEITVVEDNETAGVGVKALEIIPAQVVETQSLAVDSVSGATISSAAIKAAIADAITQAGGDAAEWRGRTIETVKEDAEYDYDVVVVGAGLAGARNKLQEVNKVNIELVENLLSVSPAVLQMYNDIGVDFNYDDSTFTASPVPSERAVKNASTIEMVDTGVKAKGCEALIASIVDRLEADGVDIYLNTAATSLITDDDGNVTGVVCENEKTGTKTFHAKAVVLCTGDYARNNDLNAELAPETVGEFTATAASNKGDGLRMAVEVGAGLHPYQESLSGNFNADPFDMPVVGQPNNQFPFSILLVDREGQRRVSEAKGPHDQQVFFIYEDEPDHGWAIMDQDIADTFLNLDTYLEKTEAGNPFIKAYKADTIEELASLIGIAPDALAGTVADYNALCEAGEDTQFNKDAKYLNPITEGPFYAVKEYDMTRGNYGGILTNADFQVVTEDGEPIPGLYATGIISSGDYFGDYYPGREALSLCAHGGYIAGNNAAEFAK